MWLLLEVLLTSLRENNLQYNVIHLVINFMHT